MKVNAQTCNTPVGMYQQLILSNFSATLNWDADSNVDHYQT